MAKKDASIGSAVAPALRSGNNTPSKEQTTTSHVNSRKFERIEKHTSPSRSPVRNKLEKIEKQIGFSPLSRSDGGKKVVEAPDLPNIQTEEKTANNSKQSSKDVNEDKKKKQDPDVGGRKRKKFDAIHYKALFKPKRTRIESDVDMELKSLKSIRVQETHVKDHKAFLEGRAIDLDQIEHDEHPQTKSLEDRSIKSDNHTFHTSSFRIENDLQNQQELDTCHKGEEALEKINRERDEEKAILENEYKVDKTFIHALYRNPSLRSEKLKILERKFDKKLEEHERLWKIRLEELKATMSTKGEEAFEKINRERDEERAILENEYKVDKSFIHALYRNPSIRSEKLKILERKFDKKLEEHERLWKIRLEELKATMLAAVRQVAAENEFSLHGSQSETHVGCSGNPEVALALPENPIEAQTHDEPVCEDSNDIKSTGSHTSAKETVDAAVSSEQIGEVPAQQFDDDMEVDVAEKVDSSHENYKGGTSSPDASQAVEDDNETGATDMAPHVDSGDMEIPDGNYNKENDEGGAVGLDTSHVEDRSETVNDVAPEVESADMGTPAGTCDKENTEDGGTFPDTPDVGDDRNETSPNDVLPHVESAESAIPVDKVKAEESIIRHDALHANENHDDSCGFDTDNPVCAPVSQDKTPSVQPVCSPASDHEIQIGPLQLVQLPDSRVQDEEIIGNLQPSVAIQLDQIIPDDEQNFPSSLDQIVAEIASDTLPPSEPSLELTCEEPTCTVPQSGEILEENLAAAAVTPHEEQQPHLATSVTPTPPVNALNMFDNLTNRVCPQMPNQTHPLQAEVERLYTVRDHVTKFHQETKQRLSTECEKEIAEIVSQISLKYEAKLQEAEAAFNSKKMELETNIHRVIMHRILAEAYRSKFQDFTPFGHHPVSQSELMQQLPRSLVSPSMKIFHTQSSGNQQPPQPPSSLMQPQLQLRPSQPPLQIVHQPAALFSATPGRLPSPALLR